MPIDPESPTTSDSRLRVVAIGASAGGVESLQTFFANVPTDTGLAFVVVQHLSKDFKSMMDTLLARRTRLAIEVVSDGVVLQPNTVYLSVAGFDILVEDGRLRLRESAPADGSVQHPINVFFESAARALGPRLTAIVLSGSGSDGALGLTAVHAAGGTALVEDPASAKFSGMPQAALRTNVVDAALSASALALRVASRIGTGAGSGSSTPITLEHLDTTRRLIGEACDADLAFLSDATLTRRIKRRIQLAQGSESELDTDEYLDRLATDATEQRALFDDLFVNVTEFFRDPPLFALLEATVVPELVEQEDDCLRVWIAGCATGQEVYSVAMTVLDVIEARPETARPRLQIFATDMDPNALGVASAGIYRREDLDHVPDRRRRKYFTRRTDGTFQVIDDVREKVVFSVHNIVTDAPFTRMHLVMCRNVLIYFNRDAMERALRVFAYALRDDGVLCLGTSENAVSCEDIFTSVDENLRVYRRSGNVSLGGTFQIPKTSRLTDLTRSMARSAGASHPRFADHLRAPASVREQLLLRFAPPSFLLDAGLQIVESIAGAEHLVRIPARQMSTRLTELLDIGDERMALDRALRACLETGEPRVISQLRLNVDDDSRTIRLAIERIDSTSTERFVLVSIYGLRGSDIDSEASDGTLTEQELHDQLRIARAELAWTMERIDSSSERSQSEHEELIATNEELQSMNEELSSVNEELYTVNTEYQSTIRELRSLNRDIDYLIEGSDACTAFLDRELCIRRFSARFTEIFSVTDADIGRPLTQFHCGLRVDDLAELMQAALETETVTEREVASEQGRQFLLRISPYSNESDEVDGCVVTAIDISRLAEARTALQKSERRLQTMTDAIPVMVVNLDPEFRYRYVNQAFADAWSGDKADLIGTPMVEHLGDGVFREIEPHLRRALDGDAALHEFEHQEDGDELSLLVNCVPEWDDTDDCVVGVYVTLTDVAHAKRAEQEMARARRAADSANRAKSEFLTNTSHEIRTPMTAILGFAELVKARSQDPETLDYVHAIERNGRHLVGLIDDILDLSKIEARKLDLEELRFDPAAVASEVIEMLRSRAQQKNLALLLEFETAVPTWIDSDPRRIRQILINLVGNAIKFTERGSVRLQIARKGTDLHFQVRDTGPGIPSSTRKRLFQPFSPGDASSTRHASGRGSGLGLAISQRLARLLGGELDVESEPDDGSVFTFRLPLEGAASDEVAVPDLQSADATPSPDDDALPRLEGRILVVDDQADIRFLFEANLSSRGATVVPADDGINALRIVDAARERAEPFDAVVLDMQMPNVDGYTVAERLRTEGHEMPIVAVTASAMRGERERCLSAGCTEYLAKPVHTAALVRLLAAHGLSTGDETVTASPAEPRRHAHGVRRVLVVEDDADTAEAIVRLLTNAGLKVASALNLRTARQRLEAFEPQLLLIDRSLSDGDGFEFAHEIRKQSDWRHLLVAALSGVHDLERQATKYGFDIALRKPVRFDQLVQTITAARLRAPRRTLDGEQESAS